MAQEWVEIQRTGGSTLKQLWIRLASGLWMPTERFKVDAQMMPPIMGGSPDTIDKQVAAGADDAYQARDGDEFTDDANDLRASAHDWGIGYCYIAGMRFADIGIAQGATIDVAYVTVIISGTSYDDALADIYCEDVDDSADFDTSATLYDRAQTEESTLWEETGMGAGSQQTPSIVSAVQEVIDRGSWESGNALMVLIQGRNVGVRALLIFRSYEYSIHTFGPELHIEYTAGPPGYYHGLKVQGEGELALCDVGNHPLRIRKGGTTYGIELVAIDDPNASRIRIKTPTGIKAIRKYT